MAPKWNATRSFKNSIKKQQLGPISRLPCLMYTLNEYTSEVTKIEKKSKITHAVCRWSTTSNVWRKTSSTSNVKLWRCPHNTRSGAYVTIQCPSGCLSVPFARCRQQCAADLLPWAWTDRLLHGRRRRGRARGSKCGQCHVYSWRRKLYADLSRERYEFYGGFLRQQQNQLQELF